MATRFEKLESDFREVLSSWINHKSAIPERWKLEEDANPINPMSYNDIQALGRAECFVLVSQARKTMIRLSSLSGILHELSAAIQAESNAAQENFKAVTNMYSLITLPNELLAHVFQFVVNGPCGVSNSSCWEAAVALSHVSQYFRSTALSCAELWTNISWGSKLSLRCISRSKEALLNVTMALAVDFKTGSNRESGKLAFEQSMADNIMPHSRRWKTLDIQFARSGPKATLKVDAKTREVFQRLDLRSLESLQLVNSSDPRFRFQSYHEFQHWTTPNLRYLTTSHYFPLSLPGLANVTKLDITLDLGQISLADVHRDLSRMKVLEVFRLRLVCGGRDTQAAQNFDKVEFVNVRSLRIVAKELNRTSQGLIKSFFSSSSFPSVIVLHVILGGYLQTSSSVDIPTLRLTSEVKCIFKSAILEQFPRVERFCLEANEMNSFGHRRKISEGYIKAGIPQGMLRSLKHLILCSNARLDAPIWDEPSPGIPVVHPRLESITIKATPSEARYMANSVKRILDRQIEGGQWEAFRELVVMYDSDKTAKDSQPAIVTEKFVGDAALEWCKNPRKT
ncbi:hypothetical protein SCHPADRAFT_993765, partial [Schizopora paradoxa]